MDLAAEKAARHWAIDVSAEDAGSSQGEKNGDKVPAPHNREEIGPVTEGSARKPIGREQQQQQDQAHGQEQEEQEQPQDSDVHSLAMELIWWDGQSATVKNAVLKIQALFRGNRGRARAKIARIAAQVTARTIMPCVVLCVKGYVYNR